MTGKVSWVSTTKSRTWATETVESTPITCAPDVTVVEDHVRQGVEGFGAAFSELGWQSLLLLEQDEREDILRELFAPGEGANFTLCRTPIGANDYSSDWYSHDEYPEDFDLEHFSIQHDLDTLVPFIEAARRHQPQLRLWASPWSPPTWMKTNKHYAAAQPDQFRNTVDNGLSSQQIRVEGTDMFIQDERYFRSYAKYFGRFIDEYRSQGIEIAMVMPQNEFNSPQVFPSCTWTSAGLTRFLGHLGPEMASRDVEVFLGTLERRDPGLVQAMLSEPEIASLVQGVGFQWAGKHAVEAIRRGYPHLRLYQTEQECGDGTNDWRYCRYAWTQLKHYFDAGVSAYMYWNISSLAGGISRWGWAQNSLVSVDKKSATFVYNHDYYVLKHVSHFVQPGARVLGTVSLTGFENQLAFRNPNGDIIVAIHNDLCTEQRVSIVVGDTFITPVLPADSFNSFVIRGGG
jgi:glucosylceramidase